MTMKETLQVSRIKRPITKASARRTVKLAAYSSVQYLRLLAKGSMHLRRDRIGERYGVEDEETYEIFRDTVSDGGSQARRTVLVVGFRLRLIRSNPFLHWVFQWICIMTTPIWSGFRGFHVKLWMVDPSTKNYLGIYEWAGEENAQDYVDWLAGLLLRLSTNGSVWYELYPGTEIDEYLSNHKLWIMQ